MDKDQSQEYSLLTCLLMAFPIIALVILFQLFIGWFISIILGIGFIIGIYYLSIYYLTNNHKRGT